MPIFSHICSAMAMMDASSAKNMNVKLA